MIFSKIIDFIKEMIRLYELKGTTSDMLYASGDCYIGEYIDDENGNRTRHGKGTMYDYQWRVIQQGTYDNGVFIEGPVNIKDQIFDCPPNCDEKTYMERRRAYKKKK